MTREEFLTLVETYGADLTRWPEPSRVGARDLIDQAPDFTSPLLTQARDLDAALDAARITPGTDMLKARILNAAKQPAAASPVPANAKPAGLRYRAVAAMMAVSFVFGFAGANFVNTGDPVEETTLTADSEWEAFAEDFGMADVYAWVDQDTAS